MKKFLMIVICLLSINLFAGVVTPKEQITACKKVLDIVPTGHWWGYQKGITLQDCLQNFQFDVLSETAFRKEIEMVGDTDNNMIIICTVVLIEFPGHEIFPPKPHCELL